MEEDDEDQHNLPIWDEVRQRYVYVPTNKKGKIKHCGKCLLPIEGSEDWDNEMNTFIHWPLCR